MNLNYQSDDPGRDLHEDPKKVITDKFRGAKKITPPLIQAIREGDPDAFKAFYYIVQRPLYAFICRFYPKFDAEDISQAIMMKVWEQREKLDPNGNIGGYLFRMAACYANNLYDRSLVEKSYLEYIRNVDNFYTGPDNKLIEEQTAILMDIALRRMPERRRRIFEMYRNEGMTHEQIAEKLKISKQAVNYNIKLAKKELSELLMLFIALVSLTR